MTEPLPSGAHVTVHAGEPTGHCRTPFYLRGKAGVIESVAGSFRNPETLAYHKPGLPKRTLYRVRFRQAELWPSYSGGGGDTLMADIFEHWLQSENEA